MTSSREPEAKITTATHIIYINAGDTKIGHPRRGWIVMNCDVKVEFFDEGYEGYGAVPLTFHRLPGILSNYIMVRPVEYKQALKLNK